MRHVIACALIAVAAAVAAAVAVAVAQSQDTVVVTGRVVEGLGETPVSDAQVRLLRRDTVQVVATARTDANGSFTFPGVLDGRYDLSAWKSGYIPGDLGQRRAGDRGYILTTAGKNISNVRVPVWKEATVGGRVVDSSGRPLAGVGVQAFGQVATAGQLVWMPQGQVATDSQGMFRITTLVAGRYLVVAGKGLPGEVVTTIFPSTRDPGGAVPIDVATGEDRMAIDIRIRDEMTFAVAGRIEQTPGRPATQVSVRLTIPDGSSRSYFVAGFAPVSPDGTFRLSRIPAGRYVLEVYAAPSVDTGVGSFVTAAEQRDSQSGLREPLDRQTLTAGPRTTQPITVTDADVAVPAIVLPQTFSIRGRVTTEPELAGPLDPLPRALLYAFSADGRTSIAAVHDPSGTFTVSDLNPGTYFLGGSLPVGWVISRIEGRGAPALDAPAVLVDQDVDDATVYLTNRTSEIAGMVRSAVTDLPDPDSSVLAFPTDRSRWLDHGRDDPRMRSARARSDGTFSLTGLPPGEYFLVGLREEFAMNWQTAETFAALVPASKKVTVGVGQKISLDVKSLSRPPKAR